MTSCPPIKGTLHQTSKTWHQAGMKTDEQLVLGAKGGDRGDAETLFRRYQDAIYGYLLRMTRSRDLAADATQETFIRGFKGLTKYKEKALFKSWLFRIAHNEGMRLLGRRSSPPETMDDALENLADTAPQPEEAYTSMRLARNIQQAMDALPAELRTVVHLRVREELPFREIAEITGTPLNTTLGRMHNARKKLKELMATEI